MWARNGHELFYLNGRQEMMSVELKAGSGFAVGEPRVLFPAGQYTLTGTSQVYDVSADGRRFVMVRPVAGIAETELVLVQNWFEELKARVGK